MVSGIIFSAAKDRSTNTRETILKGHRFRGSLLRLLAGEIDMLSLSLVSYASIGARQAQVPFDSMRVIL